MFKKHDRRREEDDRRRTERLADIRRTQDACFDALLNQPVPCPPTNETEGYAGGASPPQPPPDMPHAWTRLPRRKGNGKAKK